MGRGRTPDWADEIEEALTHRCPACGTASTHAIPDEKHTQVICDVTAEQRAHQRLNRAFVHDVSARSAFHSAHIPYVPGRVVIKRAERIQPKSDQDNRIPECVHAGVWVDRVAFRLRWMRGAALEWAYAEMHLNKDLIEAVDSLRMLGKPTEDFLYKMFENMSGTKTRASVQLYKDMRSKEISEKMVHSPQVAGDKLEHIAVKRALDEATKTILDRQRTRATLALQPELDALASALRAYGFDKAESAVESMRVQGHRDGPYPRELIKNLRHLILAIRNRGDSLG